jgi:hypothetical protein
LRNFVFLVDRKGEDIHTFELTASRKHSDSEQLMLTNISDAPTMRLRYGSVVKNSVISDYFKKRLVEEEKVARRGLLEYGHQKSSNF